jgi:hypothetical protein
MVSEQIELPSEPTRLLVAGDSHGDPLHLNFLVERAEERGCDAILHLGDFGFWPKWSDFLDETQLLLEQAALQLYFVEGNHEDYRRLLQSFPQVGPFRLVVPPSAHGDGWIWHTARGARWRWRGIRFLGIGGGYSIDKQARVRGIDWFPEETLSGEEYKRVIADPAQVDVCVFHDAPRGAPLPLELYPVVNAAWNRELLAKIVARVRPALILHAHYHCAYEGRWRDEESGASATVLGLDCNLNPAQSWAVLDLADARSKLDRWRAGEAAGLLDRGS